MTTILLSVAVVGICFAAMAIGLILRSRKVRLKGSCGGASSKNRPPDMECAACGGDPAKCENTKADEAASPASPKS